MEDSLKIGEEPVDPRARVLVAVMNNPRDLDIANDRGWYRIPLGRAPARVGAEFLAFYHTGAFEREKWHIFYCAAVRGYRIVSRRDLLPDELDHPRVGEKYFRIDIGPLMRLPEPIPSRRVRRVTFIQTTLCLLLAAKEIRDLWQNDAAEQQLWQAFRGGGADTNTGSRLGEARWAYRAEIAEVENEMAFIELDDLRRFRVPPWFAAYFSPRHMWDESPSCMDMVRAAALTGVLPPRGV